MPVVKAEKTLKLIDSTISADQGREYRRQLQIAMSQADDVFRHDEEDAFRTHLGGSTIGRDCPRALWYVFRWVQSIKHTGRIVRLFNRGHMEEPRFVAMVRACGMELFQVDENGKQFRVAGHGGHFGSAIDGVIVGCPDIPHKQPALTEMKTHGSKSYTKLVKEGVRQAKYEHFVQMQIYMKHYKLAFALYLAVNKDTDELWGEVIPFEPEVAEQYWSRAGLIVFANEPPAKISNSTATFACKFCDFSDICHRGHHPARNCRTCIYSIPLDDGSWRCKKYESYPVLDKERQLQGCEQWTMNEGISIASSTGLPSIGS